MVTVMTNPKKLKYRHVGSWLWNWQTPALIVAHCPQLCQPAMSPCIFCLELFWHAVNVEPKAVWGLQGQPSGMVHYLMLHMPRQAGFEIHTLHQQGGHILRLMCVMTFFFSVRSFTNFCLKYQHFWLRSQIQSLAWLLRLYLKQICGCFECRFRGTHLISGLEINQINNIPRHRVQFLHIILV